MKKYSLWLSLILSLGAASSSTWATPTSAHSRDGAIQVNGRAIHTGLQSVYEGLVVGDRLFLVGFKIAADRVNTPQVAEFSLSDSTTRKFWKFDEIVQGVFLFNRQVTVNDVVGNVFTLRDGEWGRLETKLPPNATVVWTDEAEELIVCHRSGLQKDASHVGGCFSTTKHWDQQLFWIEKAPKVCGMSLRVFDESAKAGMLRVFSIATGEELSRTKLRKPPNDLCRAGTR